VGLHDLQLEVRDQSNSVVARAATRLRIIPADAASNQKISLLLIGDSLTHASVYPQHLLPLCDAPGYPRLSLVGSHGPGETLGAVRHEGYGGWTARRFATHFTGKGLEGDYRQRGQVEAGRLDESTGSRRVVLKLKAATRADRIT